jgi:hypothetical protein
LSVAASTPHLCAALAMSTFRTCAPAMRSWVKYSCTARLPTIDIIRALLNV